MRKLMGILLGLSLVIGTAAVSFGQEKKDEKKEMKKKGGKKKKKDGEEKKP
jgi:hypothetical protein